MVCTKIVRPRQQALLCDECKGYCHRTCQSTISSGHYRQLVRNQEEFEWYCSICRPTATGPGPLLEEMMEAEGSQRVEVDMNVEPETANNQSFNINLPVDQVHERNFFFFFLSF